MIKIFTLLVAGALLNPLFTSGDTAIVSFATSPLAVVTDKAAPTPFSGVTVSNFPAVDFDPVFITCPAGHGALSLVLASYSLTLTNTSDYLMSKNNMDAGEAEAGLKAIVFTPVENRIPLGAVETNSFSITVTDLSNQTATATVQLPVAPSNDAPTISFASIPGIADTNTSLLFSAITVDDVDSNDAVVVTISFPDVRGSLTTNATFVKTVLSGTATYTLGSRTAQSAETFLKTVVFTPSMNRIPIGSTETTTFTGQVVDAAGAIGSDTVSLVVTPFNDAPLFSGSITTPINDNVATNLFEGFVLSDVDNTGTQRVVVTVSFGGGGGESGAGAFTNGSGIFTTFIHTNTPALATTELQGLLFLPTPNRKTVGSNETVSISVDLDDINGKASPSNRSYNLTIVSINDPPVVTPTVERATIPDSENTQPFSAMVEDYDVNDNYFTVTVAPTNPADLAVGSFSPTNTFSGTREYVETSIRGLTYVPVRNTIAGSRVLTFRFSATDTHAGEGTALASVTIVGQNDAPNITGITPDPLRTTDDLSEPPVYPFSSVLITDPDVGQTVTLTLSMDDPLKGAFSQTTLSGTVAAVTTALRAVTFRALIRADRVMGQTVTAILTITATDSAGGTRANSATTVAITSVNGAPQILGVPVTQPLLLAPTPPVRPFTGISIIDDDTNNVTVTVSLDNFEKGVLSNLGGFSQTVPGSYQMVASHGAVSAALSNLTFVVSESFVFPANAPGGTVFTIQALDTVLNLSSKSLSVILQYDPRNILVTRTADDALPGSLRYAVEHCENNGFVTFALPEYPALIRLKSNLGPIPMTHNVNFRGPGADRLTISGDSNGDGTPDLQLFRVMASVTMEGLTLTKGTSADTGGACYVGPGGALTLRYCAITESVAAQWGGAIDVYGGALSVENCLVLSNATSLVNGQGGGAISLYTDASCSFLNSTFSGNQQRSGSGIAGGAIYAENLTISTALQISIRHCTFAGNSDAVGAASSVMALGFGTTFSIGNSLFMDGHGRNLGVDGGEIISQGGNFSDDSSRTSLINGGAEEVVLLSASSDVTNIPISSVLMMPLATTVRPTLGYKLKAGSPAIGHAVAPVAGVDQLGVIRDSAPDSGALEYGVTARVVLNEIQFDPVAGQPKWLEFYVPRDSSPVDFNGLLLRVNGLTNHVFSSPLVVQPGHGLLMVDTNGTITLSPPGNTIPVLNPNVAPMNPLSAGLIELVNPAKEWNPVHRASYLGVFAEPFSPTQTLAIVNNSIALIPQFGGAAFVPHSLALPLAPPEGGVDVTRNTAINLSSPGSDNNFNEFGSLNATPQAQADKYVVGEDDLSIFSPLANDTDGDGLDQLFLFDLSPVPAAPADRAVTNSVQGAEIMLDPSTIPDAGATPKLRGTAVVYDPRHTLALQAIPVGGKITDTFSYTIVDVGSGPIISYAASGAETLVNSPGHRLTNAEEIVISGCTVSNFNGSWAVTKINDDDFTIPVAFAGAPGVNGSWVARNQRLATAASATTVTVDVLGANDYPIPGDDVVPANEDTVLRVMGDATLAGTTGLVFATDADYSMKPVVSAVSLLTNDQDPDTDDDASTLKLTGVLGQIHAITNYEGSVGVAPVVVRAPGHGLADGASILISGYAGHPSYNGYHVVSVLDSNTLSMPVLFVDNAAIKGHWGILTDTGRLVTATALGATVTLDIRAARAETSLVYDPTRSAPLNHLAVGETGTDTFYCAVLDGHGAVSIGLVTVMVAGRNDAPVVVPDPGALAPLVGWPGGSSLPELLPELDVLFILDPASGSPNHADIRVRSGTNGSPWVAALTNLWLTDEDTSLDIDSTELLANDSDVDTSDHLVVSNIPVFSQLGAQLTLVSNGLVIVYNPITSTNLNALARNELKIDNFETLISDQNGGVRTSLVAVLVSGRDDKPIANNDRATVFENQTLTLGPTVGVLSNDVEYDINGKAPDNRYVLIDRTNSPTRIPDVWHIYSNNTVYYNPAGSAFLEWLAEGQTYTDKVFYTMMDGSFVFANKDYFRVQAGSSNVTLDVLSNDRNYTGTGGSLRVIEVGQTSQGGVCAVGSGSSNLVYTPPPGFVGDEVVTYLIDDGQGNTDRAQILIRVTVNRLNGVLQANPDFFSVARGESGVLNVLGNDNVLPETGTNLTVAGVVMAPTMGGLALLASNNIIFTPDPGYGGSYPYVEQFHYAVSGGGSALSTSVVEVLVVNRIGALEVRDDVFSVEAGSLGNSLDVLVNDDILPGLPVVLTVKSIGPVAHGVVTIDGDERGVSYVPQADFIGIDTFFYVATDRVGGTGTGVVTVAVGNLTASADTFVVTNLSPVVELNVLANDLLLQETFGDNLTIASVTPTNPAMGALTVKTGGKRLLFGPVTQLGAQTCVYTITDGGGRTASANVHLVVKAGGISANSDEFAVVRDSSENLLDVLRNDATFPSQGKTLTITSVNTPNRGGTVTRASDGLSLTYTPLAEFSGEETFTYTMTDSVLTDTAQVVVKVSRGVMTANPDLYSVYLDTPAQGADPVEFVLPVMINDAILPDFGQALSIVSLGNGTNAPDRQGTVTIGEGAQTLTYVPYQTNGVADYTERFTYEISDGTEWRAEGVVNVRVLNRTNAVDMACQDDAFAVERSSANNVLGVLNNDGIKPGTPSGWSLTGVSTSEVGGVVSLIGNTVRYSPLAGYVGLDHFSYQVSDGLGGTGEALVTVMVGGLTLNKDYFTVISESQSNALDVLVNDPMIPVTPGIITNNYHLLDAGGTTASGTVWVSNGQVMYSPLTNYAGSWPYAEEFIYRVVDDSGLISTGTTTVGVYQKGADRSNALLRVTVVGVNDAPVITGTQADQYYLLQGIRPFPGVTIRDVDNYEDELQIVTVSLSNPEHGTLTSLGAFSAMSNGVTVLSGVTPSQATAALRQLVFTPMLDGTDQGNSRTTRVSIAVNDSHVTVLDTNTTLLASLVSWPGSNALSVLLPQTDVLSAVEARSGIPHHADVRIQSGTNGSPWLASLSDVFFTDEDTRLDIPARELLGSESALYFSNQLAVSNVPAFSELGAQLGLASNGVVLIYNPVSSTNLNSLARNEMKMDSFNAIINDQLGGVLTSLVAVLVIGRDDSPAAFDDTASVFENQTLTLGPTDGVLSNDVENDINALAPDNRYILLDQTNHPTHVPDAWVAMSNNTVFYNPASSAFLERLAIGQTFVDSMDYTMMDGSFVFANQDLFSVRAGSSNQVLNVLANDRNDTGSGGALRIIAAGATSQNGQCVIGEGATNLVYTPAHAFVGDELLTYLIDDGFGNVDRAQVLIKVAVDRLNEVLRTRQDFFTVAQGESAILDVLGVESNLAVSAVVWAPTMGGRAEVTNNCISFTPSTNYAGAYPYNEQFSYAASNSGSVGETNLVDILVISRLGALEVRDDGFSVEAGSPVVPLDVLANDDILPDLATDLTVLTVGIRGDLHSGVGPVANGVVAIATNGLGITYIPDDDFTGIESFIYVATDGRGGTGTGVVTIAVGNLGAIEANPDLYTVYLDDPAQGASSNVLSVLVNDYIQPVSTQTLSIVSLGAGSNAPDHQGAVSISSNAQTLLYVPYHTNGVLPYTERFTYTVADGAGRQTQAVVNVRVLNRFTCQDDAFAVERGSLNNVLAVLGNDGQTAAAISNWRLTGVTTSAVGGVVSVHGNSVRYSPPAGYIGLDHFAYEVSDGAGTFGTASVTVSVGALTLNFDYFTVISGSQSNALDVLANDPIIPVIQGSPTNRYHLLDAGGTTGGGTVWIDDGKVMYRPLVGYAGPWTYADDFFYRVMDDFSVISTGSARVVVYRDGADRSNAVLRITMNGVNDAPAITGAAAGQRYYLQGIKPFQGITISDVDNFGDEWQEVTVTLLSPGHGSLTSLGAFTAVSNGTVRLTGVTPAQASAAIRNLVFEPVMDAAGPGNGRTTRVSISVYDGTVTVTDTNTTLIDTPVAEVLLLAGSTNGLFGSAVAASSNLVVAGLPSDVSNGVTYASALFYQKNNTGSGSWAVANKARSVDSLLTPASDMSVALEGDTLIVGSPRGVLGAVCKGVAYVYYRNQGGSNQWGLVKTLTAFDGDVDELFGTHVAISGDLIVVGSPRARIEPFTSGGAAYVFGRNTGGTNQWNLVKKLVPSSRIIDDLYGFSVAISGDSIAIGSPYRDDYSGSSGIVYLYMQHKGGSNQWGVVQTRYATLASAIASQFGYSVSMRDDLLVVGAPYEVINGTNSGAAYMFGRNQGGTTNWGQVRKFLPSSGSTNQSFGSSVSLDRDWLAIGAQSDSSVNGRTGSAYLYARSYPGLESWGLVQRFTPVSGATNGGEYGCSVSVGGGVLAVGAHYNSSNVFRSGATYIYELMHNNPAYVAHPLSNQIAVVNSPFGFILPEDTFADPDFGNTLTLAADYSLSPSLAGWLAFDPVSRAFSGTPTALGTNTVLVTAQGPAGVFVTNAFLLVVVTNTIPGARSTPLEQWRDLYFGSAVFGGSVQETSARGNDEDADGDGIPNLTEYVFGTNPRIADLTDPSRITLAPMGGNAQWVEISFRRRTGDWYLTLSLEASSNLISWLPIGGLLIAEDVIPLSPGIDSVTQYVLLPGPLEPLQFYRLRVAIVE